MSFKQCEEMAQSARIWQRKCIDLQAEIERLKAAFMELCEGLEAQLGPGTPTEWVAEIELLQAVVGAALDMRGIYGMSTNMEKALAALEGKKDEIERLFASEQWLLGENAKLRAALHSIARNQMKAWGDEFQKGINSQAETALAALEGE